MGDTSLLNILIRNEDRDGPKTTELFRNINNYYLSQVRLQNWALAYGVCIREQ